jgi:hypothetical protein
VFAADVRAREKEVVTEEVAEEQARLDGTVELRTVHGQADVHELLQAPSPVPSLHLTATVTKLVRVPDSGKRQLR